MQLFPGTSFKTFLYYGIGALGLIALAEYQPQLAILFVVLLVVGVLLTHWQDYASLISTVPGGTTTKGA